MRLKCRSWNVREAAIIVEDRDNAIGSLHFGPTDSPRCGSDNKINTNLFDELVYFKYKTKNQFLRFSLFP
jgi:hypothetical protein